MSGLYIVLAVLTAFAEVTVTYRKDIGYAAKFVATILNGLYLAALIYAAIHL